MLLHKWLDEDSKESLNDEERINRTKHGKKKNQKQFANVHTTLKHLLYACTMLMGI